MFAKLETSESFLNSSPALLSLLCPVSSMVPCVLPPNFSYLKYMYFHDPRQNWSVVQDSPAVSSLPLLLHPAARSCFLKHITSQKSSCAFCCLQNTFLCSFMLSQESLNSIFMSVFLRPHVLLCSPFWNEHIQPTPFCCLC